jgi:hypothetical protein
MKKTKLKLKLKNKQKQKQKQSVIVNIDNSRKTLARNKKPQSSQQNQSPSIIPQPIYVPQYSYAPPPFGNQQPFRQEPEKAQAFNPVPINNPSPLVPQQIQPSLNNNNSYYDNNSYYNNSDVSLSSTIPSYMKPISIIDDDTISTISTPDIPEAKPIYQERNFNFMNETPEDRIKASITQPKTLPPQTLLTAKKYLDEKLIYNNNNSIGNRPSFESEESYKIPSALEKEIKPVNEITPPMVNDFGGVSANYDDEYIRTPKSNVRTCQEINKTGISKGQVCGRPLKGNTEFCGYHQPTRNFNRPKKNNQNNDVIQEEEEFEFTPAVRKKKTKKVFAEG